MNKKEKRIQRALGLLHIYTVQIRGVFQEWYYLDVEAISTENAHDVALRTLAPEEQAAICAVGLDCTIIAWLKQPVVENIAVLEKSLNDV